MNMDRTRLLTSLKTFLRLTFVIVNNLYCIPVHVVWICFFYPLKFISEDTYWLLEGTFFRWLLSMVALWSYTSGYHIVEYGDYVWDLVDKRTVILFNHQSTSDVPMIMAAFNSHKGVCDNVMWIMDRMFKFTNFGLVSWFHGDFFIRAGREYRDESLRKLTKHMREFYGPRGRKWVVLFPEGGFLKNRKPSSQRYAKKNNLPHLENVALPRVGALKVILDESSHSGSHSGIEYLIDVTIAYPGGRPLDLQTILGGWKESCDVIFHYRKFTVKEIPRDEECLSRWMYQRYIEKEAILQQYYDTSIFPDAVTPHEPAFKPEAELLCLRGAKVTHDVLEFIFRHMFYLCSTWVWFKVLKWLIMSVGLLFSV